MGRTNPHTPPPTDEAVIAEQYIPGHLGELITDEFRTSDGYVGVTFDGFRWQYVPPGWWVVGLPGIPLEILPSSRYEETYGRS